MRNAVVDPIEMQGFTAVVLAVHAAMSPDVLQQQFAAQAKAGPSDKLPNRCGVICRGLALQALPGAAAADPVQCGVCVLRADAQWSLVG